MEIIPYITEEVTRQGHDIHTKDGLERVGWMLDGWCYALSGTEHDRVRPTVFDAETLGKMIEPSKNVYGFRLVNVRVGMRSCPDYSEVRPKIVTLFEEGDLLTPIEFYKEFELIHPFRDGNGRVGKIIYSWLLGRLHDPIFPPGDLFGAVIRNP